MEETSIKSGNEISCQEETIGRWKDDEHKKFLEAYELYGNNWRKIHAYVKTRTATQARSHAQKYFRRMNRLKNLSNEKTALNSPSINVGTNESKTLIKPGKRPAKQVQVNDKFELDTNEKSEVKAKIGRAPLRERV